MGRKREIEKSGAIVGADLPFIFPHVEATISVPPRVFFEVIGQGEIVLCWFDESAPLEVGNKKVWQVGVICKPVNKDDVLREAERVFLRVVGDTFFLIKSIKLKDPANYIVSVRGYPIKVKEDVSPQDWAVLKETLIAMTDDLIATRIEGHNILVAPFPFNVTDAIDTYARLKENVLENLETPLRTVMHLFGFVYLFSPPAVRGIVFDKLSQAFEGQSQVSLSRLISILMAFLDAGRAAMSTLLDIVEKVKREDDTNSKVAALLRMRDEINQEIAKLKGKTFETRDEIDELLAEANSRQLPPEVKQYIVTELERLKSTPFLQLGAEVGVTVKHIKFLLSLPWDREAEEVADPGTALAILENHFYGMRAAKEKIIDYLATLHHIKQSSLKGTILCFVGAPGTGKTDVARRIAEALGRPFVRISLGGVDDEAIIKGHRRTYVGAMAGNIMKALSQAQVKNPVILLDEVDKMVSGVRGDPAAALLEALDPTHNTHFFDHYVDFPFDLSKVLFICAANVYENIHPTLRDRLEVVEFPPYTPKEKIIIARKHLLPRWFEELKLPPDIIQIPDDTIYEIITRYTFEGGVRELNRLLKVVLQRRIRGVAPEVLSPADLPKVFWDINPMHVLRRKEKLEVGQAPILAASTVTGDGFLEYIGIVQREPSDDKTEIDYLAQVDDTFKESFRTALSWFCRHFGVKNMGKLEVFKTQPAWKVSGTSAGVALALALCSIHFKKPLAPWVCFSGEISPFGDVSPVGGIANKVALAEGLGFTVLILPEDNKVDVSLLSTPPSIKIVYVRHMKEVLEFLEQEGGWVSEGNQD